jgi:hypothetical protein
MVEEDGRPTGTIHAAVNLRRFQVCVNRLIDDHQLTGPLQVINALSQVVVTHRFPDTHRARRAVFQKT